MTVLSFKSVFKRLNIIKNIKNIKNINTLSNKKDSIKKIFLFLVITMLFLNVCTGLLLNINNLNNVNDIESIDKNITSSNYKIELLKELAQGVPVMDRGTEYVITLVSVVMFSILAYVFFAYLCEEHKKQRKRLEKSKKRKEPSYL
ncbi:hypothetical protein [Methanococcus voltae]|uniref:Uncharacterized protein n=1 Tax=Methanococcus voltae (strain ATCC BAA-1334 / A3) TaxID=456320 RepID=D7DT00_METV3|nr:hypothetical protein [Methanococcus voltae]MCS3901964.1 ABC-type maltose transport system permease subunit [Methanococcus voltae]